MWVPFFPQILSVFQKNSSHLIEKAHRAIFGLNLHIKDSVGYLPPDLAIKMFDKQIRPILDFCLFVLFLF